MRHYCKSCEVEFNFYGEFNLSGGGIYPHKFENCPICYTYPFRRIPDYETPEQYEKRTGKKWNGAVYSVIDANYETYVWEGFGNVELAKAAKLFELGSPIIVCAQSPEPPPDNWRPKEEA